jgi:putative transposase
MALSFSQQAQARYRIIQPFLERGVPLTALSRQHGISERALRRWVASYREHGLASLERRTRSDDGQRRKISDEMVDLIRSYGLQKPRLPITAIHRKVVAHAQAAST